MFIPIPIRFQDGREFHAIPVVNGLLVVLNVLIFFLGYGPTDLAVGRGSGFLTILTHAFGHAGAWHLVGNMWALLVFGTPVNRRLGNGWYLAVYFGTVLAMGLFGWVCCSGRMVGASGAVFAIIAIALMLFPSALITIAYFALFPVTLIAGLLSMPQHWVFWFIRWDTFEMRAYWGLLLVPLLEVWGLFCSGWNWTNLAHLSGLMFGLIAVLLLPTTITMNRRSRVRFV
jgi:membrane associated rhomboid family serine protease